MAIDTGAVDRALGAIGTTFRLTRLYPPSHPAVLEAMRHITASLPALAGLGSVEWKVGATGLIWHGQHLLPRNTQVAELAGLLFARGIRAIQVNPGVTAEHWLGLFGVAVGNVAPDDAVLGRITVHLGRRATQRLTAARVIIVVAGMEGALPSVVGGLVARPVIACPTSVGYGASFGGLAALLAMLSSCTPGVVCVNIDDGVGAGYTAALIARRSALGPDAP